MLCKYSELPVKDKTTIMSVRKAVSYNILLSAVHEYKVSGVCMYGSQ